MKPLVTVAITTYHSALYILETLDSIYEQTYENIALVVSDDGSTDNTIALVNQWLSEGNHAQRFKSVEVITVPINTGVSANCNRCIAAAPSDWLKYIAGDDILLPDCIADNVSFIQQNPEANIIFSQVKIYQDTFEEENYVRTMPLNFPENIMSAKLTAADQYQLLLLSDRINYTPSSFVNKQIQINIGGFDETNRLVEDYPMWLQLTNSGQKLFYFHKPTVGYRIHSKAANNVSDDVIFKPSALNSFPVRKAFAHPFLPWEIVRSEYHVYWISKIFQKNGWNKNRKRNKKLYHFASFYLNPFYYIFAIKKRLPANQNNPFYF